MKKDMKELWLLVSLLLCCHSIVDAATYSGNCGTNVNYSLNTSTGELIVTGSGTMNISGTTPPWDSYKSYIKKVSISNGVTSIESGAFWGCTNLTDIKIPSSVNEIGRSAFYYCSALTDVIIPEGVTMIDDFTFYNCSKLTSVVIPNNVTTMGSWVFENCSGLAKVTIGDSVVKIGSSAFANCTGITSVTIGNGVASIGNRAFYNCKGITSITIPQSVGIIESSAFEGCEKLSKVINNSVLVFKKGVSEPGGYITKYATELVQDEYISYGSCGTSVYYKLKTNGELVISGIGDMNNYSVSPWRSDYNKLKKVTINNGVTKIGSYAFENCTNIINITIPSSVTCISQYSFWYCN